MTTLEELLAKKKELEQQIEQIRKAERADALRNARTIIANFGFTAEDLFGTRKEQKRADAKYRNPETGETWSGRGRAPRWLEGKNREDFAA